MDENIFAIFPSDETVRRAKPFHYSGLARRRWCRRCCRCRCYELLCFLAHLLSLSRRDAGAITRYLRLQCIGCAFIRRGLLRMRSFSKSPGIETAEALICDQGLAFCLLGALCRVVVPSASRWAVVSRLAHVVFPSGVFGEAASGYSIAFESLPKF